MKICIFWARKKKFRSVWWHSSMNTAYLLSVLSSSLCDIQRIFPLNHFQYFVRWIFFFLLSVEVLWQCNAWDKYEEKCTIQHSIEMNRNWNESKHNLGRFDWIVIVYCWKLNDEREENKNRIDFVDERNVLLNGSYFFFLSFSSYSAEPSITKQNTRTTTFPNEFYYSI